MGKIFGISDLPVSTIMTPFEMTEVPKPKYNRIVNGIPEHNAGRDFISTVDSFVSQSASAKSNPFVKMRNGIGKLMKHFSKKLVK